MTQDTIIPPPLPKRWFYLAGDEKVGPLDEEEIFSLIARQKISANYLVWRAGMTEWAQVLGLPEFKAAFMNRVSRSSEEIKVQKQTVDPALIPPALPPSLPESEENQRADSEQITEHRASFFAATHQNSSLDLKLKQGAAIGGWLCFILGIAFMFYSVWVFMIYVPLFLAAFILAIIAMAQKRLIAGIILLLATLIVPPGLWFLLSITRMTKFAEDHPVPSPISALGGEKTYPTSNKQNAQPLARTTEQSAPDAEPTAATQNQQNNDQTVIDELLKEPLSNAHAWQLQIVYTRILATDVPSFPLPVFSADGKNVMYPQQPEGQPFRIVVANLQDHSTQTVWTPASGFRSLAWSPDGKKLAYAGEVNLMGPSLPLHIVDWATKKDVAIPISVGPWQSLSWIGENKIGISDNNEPDVLDSTVNLDTLGSEHAEGNKDMAELRNQYAQTIIPSQSHPFCIVEARTLKFYNGTSAGPFLFVSERDRLYQKALQCPPSQASVTSADLRHILTLNGGVLSHCYIGLCAMPTMTYKIELDNKAVLDAKHQAELDYFRAKQVPFSGEVYSPLINPLNGNVVGPDPNRPKGRVTITEWHDAYLTVRVSAEISPIEAGDIVANIACEQLLKEGNHNFEYGDLWRPLLAAPQDATSQDSAKSASSVAETNALVTDHAVFSYYTGYIVGGQMKGQDAEAFRKPEVIAEMADFKKGIEDVYDGDTSTKLEARSKAYSAGCKLGYQLKNDSPARIIAPVFCQGLQDALDGKPSKVTPEAAEEAGKKIGSKK